jgi:hypothetical protein
LIDSHRCASAKMRSREALVNCWLSMVCRIGWDAQSWGELRGGGAGRAREGARRGAARRPDELAERAGAGLRAARIVKVVGGSET